MTQARPTLVGNSTSCSSTIFFINCRDQSLSLAWYQLRQNARFEFSYWDAEMHLSKNFDNSSTSSSISSFSMRYWTVSRQVSRHKLDNFWNIFILRSYFPSLTIFETCIFLPRFNAHDLLLQNLCLFFSLPSGINKYF